MAFEFPRRNPAELFFPTVHIHDEKIHPLAEFDHELYFQLDRMPQGMRIPGHESREILKRWASLEAYLQGGKMDAASSPIEQAIDIRRAAGTLLPSVPLYRMTLQGELTNQDSTLEI